MSSTRPELSVQYIHDVYSMEPKKPAVAQKAKPKRAAAKKKVVKPAADIATPDSV